MQGTERLDELRELFLSAPESSTVQLLAFVLAATLVAVVLWMVRRRTLRAEYTPIWMGVSLALLVVSLDLSMLRTVARWLGAWTVSSTVFFLGEFFLLAICLNYAVRLSDAGSRIRQLGQEVAVLRLRIEQLEGRGGGGPPG